MCLYVCTLPRQVSVTLFGLGSWASVTVPLSATLANVTRLAEAWRRLSFNHWSLRTTHLIRLDLRFAAAEVTQPNPGVNQLITDPRVLRLCHHREDGEGGATKGRSLRGKEKRILTRTSKSQQWVSPSSAPRFPFSSVKAGRVCGSGLQHLDHTHPSERSLDPWD